MGQNKIHSDQKYIDGIVANNSEVIQVIYKKFVPNVVFFVLNNSGDENQAQNVVQEVLILIFNYAKAQHLRLTCPFEAYFFSLCKRKWLNEFEKTANKGVKIHEHIGTMNESELELIKQTEEFDLKQHSEFKEESEALEENLKSISDSHFNRKLKVVSLKPWYYTIAISVVVLCGLFFFDYNTNPVYSDFDHPEQAFFIEKGNTNTALKQAEKAYNTRKYEEAIPFFETALKETNSPEIEYFYGVSLLQENEFKKAEAVFNKLKIGKSAYKNRAMWNLALSKLKQKDYRACKEILQNISQDYEGYDDVQELLSELD